MTNQRQVTLDDINIELVKINLRWRIATSLISISLAGIASYGQIKLQELQSSVVSNEVLKTQVTTINESLKDMRIDMQSQRELITTLVMENKGRR